MRRLAATWIVASVLALFHIIVVVVPVLSSHASGEGQAFIVALLDFPLVAYLQRTSGGSRVLYDDMAAYTQVFCIGGTLMYVCVGAVLGFLIDAVRYGTRKA